MRVLIILFLFASVICGPAIGEAWAKKVEVSFEKCLKCHPDVKEQMGQEGAHEPFRKLQCSSCHNPHAAKYEGLLKDEVGKLCKSCHEGEKGLMAKKYSHDPFEDGQCLKCHRPHNSKNSKLLAAKGAKLCFGCHSKKGSFSAKHKHDPVKKGKCLSCHRPHTSDYDGLAKAGRKKLCVDCHSIDGEKIQKSHLNYPVQGTDCVSCHSPHGSKRTSLIKETLHKPFAKKQCKTCHNGLGSSKPLGVKGKGASTCMKCHPGIKEDFKKVNSHVGQGMFCVNCHNPHASDEGHLRKAKEAKMCFDCHEDTKNHVKDKKNQHKHPLVKEGKCSPCHSPHGSDFRLFLANDEIRLCTECHERHAKFTHPIGKDAIDPRSKRDIVCITCHNLMGSPYQFALRFDRKKELCIQCHKGY